MIKKTMTITLVDGSKILRDITYLQLPGLPIGAPPNHEAYAQLCLVVGCQGTTNDGETNDKKYTHVPPSQIKKVVVEFEEPKLQKA